MPAIKWWAFFVPQGFIDKFIKKFIKGLTFNLNSSMLLSVTETVEKTRKGGKNEDVKH